MKKISAFIAVSLLCAGSALAQDINVANEKAQQATEAFNNNDFTTAIENYKAAITEASACGEEGAAELAASCKDALVKAYYKMALQTIKDGDMEKALTQLDEAKALATEYSIPNILDMVKEKQDALHLALSNAKRKEASKAADAQSKLALLKDAIAHLDIILAEDPSDTKAVISKAQVLSSINDKDGAIEFFTKAKELGMEEEANSGLSNIYLKEAQKAQKAGKFAEAIAAAKQSNEYKESATAYRIAGYAAYSAKDMKNAETYLSKYIELTPTAKDAANVKAAIAAAKAAQGK